MSCDVIFDLHIEQGKTLDAYIQDEVLLLDFYITLLQNAELYIEQEKAVDLEL